METRKGEVITRREIDVMGEEELLDLVRRHAKLLGERFPKQADRFYCPDILDESHLLRKLYRLDRERFVELVQEQNKREYIAGGHWAAILISQGEPLPDEVLCRQEQVMSKSLTQTEERTHSNGRGYEWKETHEYTTALAMESALFWDVSEKARGMWRNWYDRYCYQTTKSNHLAEAFSLRETWLGASHADSAQILCSLGWKPLDMMLAYLLGVHIEHYSPVDPDCAADAARRDPETAVKLMDSDQYKTWFGDQLHPTYFVEMAQTWREFLYLQYGWPDKAPLEKGHRLKKADAHCKLVLERLRNPGWPQRDFEEELKRVGLLISETPPVWDSSKLAKLQRLALTRAMIYHYQWRAGELRSALAAAPKPELFTALVWGVYQKDRLENVFLLDGAGTAWGEDGAPFPLSDDAQVGLVVPTEMTKGQLILWKKRLKETGGKPPIRQLTIPSQPPEWGEFEGAVTKHITIYTVSGKWGLDMGALSKHCRADLLDPLHGYGARITFEAVWNGPEYNEEDVSVSGVTFYHMDPLPFEDYLPQRAVVPPEKLPARFVCLAGAAFRQLAGLN